MITTRMRRAIRRLERQGASRRAIARELGVARDTVRAVLESPRDPSPATLADLEPQLLQVVSAQGPRPPATAIARRVGWRGSMSTFRRRLRVLEWDAFLWSDEIPGGVDSRTVEDKHGPGTSASADHRARNARMRSLRASEPEAWTLSRLGREFGISKQRVGQVLAQTTRSDLDVDDLALELRLRSELYDVLMGPLTDARLAGDDLAMKLARIRLRAIKNELDRLHEERESRSIDRILGLN